MISSAGSASPLMGMSVSSALSATTAPSASAEAIRLLASISTIPPAPPLPPHALMPPPAALPPPAHPVHPLLANKPAILLEVLQVAEHPQLHEAIPFGSEKLFIKACAPVWREVSAACRSGDEDKIDRAVLNLLMLPGKVLVRRHGGGSARARRDVNRQCNEFDRAITVADGKVDPASLSRSRGHAIIPDASKAKVIRARRAESYVKRGHVKKAAAVLDQSGLAEVSQQVINKLKDLHPPLLGLPILPHPPQASNLIVAKDALKKAFRTRVNNGASAGPSGWTGDHLAVLINEDCCCDGLLDLTQLIANGRLRGKAREMLLSCRLIAGQKPAGGVRPIASGEVLYKLADAVVVESMMPHLAKILQPCQVGTACAGGGEIALHAIQCMIEKRAALLPANLNATAVYKIDLRNAFNKLSRHKLLETLYKHPELSACFDAIYQAYCQPSALVIMEGSVAVDVIQSAEGVRQGAGPSAPLFCLTFLPVMLAMIEGIPQVKIVAFCDDAYIYGTPGRVIEAMEQASTVTAHANTGTEINPDKSSFLLCDPSVSSVAAISFLDKIEPYVQRANIYLGTMPVLGSMVGIEQPGMRLSREEFCLHKVGEVKGSLDSVRYNDHLSRQAALAILRLSISKRIQHLWRTIPPRFSCKAAKAFDSLLVQALIAIFKFNTPHTNVDEVAYYQLLSPSRFGGFGVTSSTASVESAYIASIGLASHYLVNTLVLTLNITTVQRNALPIIKSAYDAINDLRSIADFPESIAIPSPGKDLIEHYNQHVGAQLVLHGVGLPIRGAARPRKAPTTHLGQHLHVQRILTSQVLQAKHSAVREKLLATMRVAARVGGNGAKKNEATRMLARLNSCCGLYSGTVWSTLPTDNALEMDDDTIIINAHMRLGLPATVYCGQDCKLSLCICNRALAPAPGIDDPNHLFVCNKLRQPLSIARHDIVKNTLGAMIKKAGGALIVEPRPQADAKKGVRVDISGSFAGFSFSVDVAVVQSTCNTHYKSAASTPGSTAESMAAFKQDKHGDEAKRIGYEFFPFVLEAAGTWHAQAQALCKRIAKEAAKNSLDPHFKEGAHYTKMIQSISAALAKGNAHGVRAGLLKIRHDTGVVCRNGYPLAPDAAHDPMAGVLADGGFASRVASLYR